MESRSASALTDALLSDGTGTSASFPRIEGYCVLGELGRGAGGVVYRARALASDRPVALKILHCDGAKQGRAKRAWRELDILADIRSSCVPNVIDYGYSAGRMYIATELIDGSDLLTYIKQNDLSRRDRVLLLARIADAVQVLHEHGVIHRDLKPSNILINANGEPVIIDLGIAALIESDVMQTLTADGAPIGTPAYMAPEQARGDRALISTRSDVYALGALAYHALTGETPHEQAGTLYETVRRVGHDDPRDARELEPTLPKPLAAVLTKACARRPKDRYDSAAALGEDFRMWLVHEPVSASVRPIRDRLWKIVRRHPLLVTTTLCAAISLISVTSTFAFVQWLNQRPYSIIAPSKGEPAQIRARNGRILREFGVKEGKPYLVGKITSGSWRRPNRFVIASSAQTPAQAELEAGLYVFRSDDLTNPLWTYKAQLPPQLRHAVQPTATGGHFLVRALAIADVLPSPGPEIISAHCHDPYSPSAIAIHTPDGDLLDLVWHDGRIYSVLPIPGTNRIVCAGVNSEAFWADRGYSIKNPHVHPCVVFAFDTITNAGARFISDSAGLATMRPAWYHALLPPEACDTLRTTPDTLRLEIGGDAPLIRVKFEAVRGTGSASFYLSPDGELIGGFASDSYLLRDDLTTFEQLRLGPLPPTVESPLGG